MLPIYPGGHVAYQNFVVEQLRNHYANPAELPDFSSSDSGHAGEDRRFNRKRSICRSWLGLQYQTTILPANAKSRSQGIMRPVSGNWFVIKLYEIRLDTLKKRRYAPAEPS